MKETLKRIKHLISLDRPELQFVKKILPIRQIVSMKWRLKGKPLPPPHFVKQAVIKKFIRTFNYHYFVETGTYLGAMISTVLRDFKTIYTIELSSELHEQAVKLFKNYKHVHCLQGDSGSVLKDLAPKLDQGSIFWLDGHYSGGITALGNKVCPIYEELDSIISSDNHNHIILIDDARLFLSGEQEYPLFSELSRYVKSLNSSYNIYIFKTDTIVVTKANLNDYSSFNHYIQPF